jgi:hypothetical protein
MPNRVFNEKLNDHVVMAMQNEIRNSLHNIIMCSQSIGDVRDALFAPTAVHVCTA